MPKPKPSIFISYANVDRDKVDYLRRDLARLRLNVWEDVKITPGENWSEQLERALQGSRIYLLFISPDSLKSDWANFEMGVASARASGSSDVTLIPVIHHGAKWEDLPVTLRDRAGINANEMSWDELSETLRKRLEELSVA